MALNTRISNLAAIDACNAIVDRFDVGTGVATVQIRTGAQPADPDTVTSGTLLSTINLNDPVFGTAIDATPGGIATADITPALSDTSAAASGTAGYFRGFQDGGTVALIDGECGTSGADLNLDNLSIAIGQTVTITSWTITMPET